MRYNWKVVARLTAALALVAALALIPAAAPSSCMLETAQGRPAQAGSHGEFSPYRGPLGAADAEVVSAPSVEPAPALGATAPTSAPVARKQPAAPPGNGEAEAPDAEPFDPPAAARIDPLLERPTNLSGVYSPQGWGNSRNDANTGLGASPTGQTE